MKSHLGLLFYQVCQRLRRRGFTLLVRGGFRAFGAGSALAPPVKLEGTESISIGSEVYIGPNSWLTFLPDGHADSSSHACGIFIGHGVSIAGDCVLSAVQQIVLEDHVLLGRHVHLADHAHRFGASAEPVLHQGLTAPAPVRIGRGAWLGQGVVVCPGVTIGRNAVIGANSVVREDVPAFSLAAGAPATVKRYFGNP